MAETLLLSDLTNINPVPDSLTFCVTHKIIRIAANKYDTDPKRAGLLAIKYESDIIDYRKQYSFKWKVERNPTANCSSSDIVGEMFAATYNHNQNTVRLILCGLPSKKQIGDYVDVIQVEWSLRIKDCDELDFNNVALFAVGKEPIVYENDKQVLSTFDMDDYKEMDEFVFCVDVFAVGG